MLSAKYLLSFSISLILIIILVDTFSKNCIWRYLTCLSNVLRHQPPSYSSFYYCSRSDAEFALLTNCRFLLFQRVASYYDPLLLLHTSWPKGSELSIEKNTHCILYFIVRRAKLQQYFIHFSLWRGKILIIQGCLR